MARARVSTPLGIFCLAALLRLFVVWLVHDSTQGQPLFPDAQGYDAASATIADGIRSGGIPSPHDLAGIVGSQVWGYPAVMALAKVMSSGGWLSAKLLLALIGASSAPAAYLLAHASGTTSRRALSVGLLIAASPSLILFDAWGLKDALVVSILLWSLLVIVKARFWVACIATLISVQTLLYVRPIAALFVLAALLVRVRVRSRYFAGGVLLAVGCAYVVLPRIAALADLSRSLRIDSSTGFGFTGGPEATNLLTHPQYIATFLFGPYPWAYGPGTQGPQRWLYLGTTVWIAILVLAPASIRAAWRDSRGMGRPLIAGSVTYGLLYLVSFGGAFYRQRSILETTLLLLVVVYMPASRAAIASRLSMWLAFVAALALLQSNDLSPTLTSKVIILAVLVALVGVTLGPVRGRRPMGGLLRRRPLRREHEVSAM